MKYIKKNTNMKMPWVVLIYAFGFLLMLSCTDNLSDISLPESKISSVLNEKTLIDSENITISEQDARMVASKFTSRFSTKGNDSRSVSSVVSIADNESEVAYYAVNFSNNEGFILVSATKNYTPILGYFDTGNFSSDCVAKNTPLSLYLKEYLGDIQSINTVEIDSLRIKYASSWSEFELNPAIETKANAGSLRISYDKSAEMAKWTAKGYECHSLSAVRYFLGTQEGDLFIRDIQSHTYPGVDPMEASILLIKRGAVQNGPLLSTEWHQELPFSYGTQNGYAGCVTIAMAQIMAYHKWPNAFNWTSIGVSPSNTNAEAQRLCVDIRKNIKANDEESDGTGSTIKKACAAFNDVYSYRANYEDSNVLNTTQINNIEIDVAAGYPLYMKGGDVNGKGAHAWVCDGRKNDYTTYSAVYISEEYGMYDQYFGVIKDSDHYFHMNWGNKDPGSSSWSNGWVYVRNANIENCNFSVDRKIMFVRPKR